MPEDLSVKNNFFEPVVMLVRRDWEQFAGRLSFVRGNLPPVVPIAAGGVAAGKTREYGPSDQWAAFFMSIFFFERKEK